jgi:hypothetical protein
MRRHVLPPVGVPVAVRGLDEGLEPGIGNQGIRGFLAKERYTASLRQIETGESWEIRNRIAQGRTLQYGSRDGNGRLSRVLTRLLLLRAGYAWVPYQLAGKHDGAEYENRRI